MKDRKMINKITMAERLRLLAEEAAGFQYIFYRASDELEEKDTKIAQLEQENKELYNQVAALNDKITSLGKCG